MSNIMRKNEDSEASSALDVLLTTKTGACLDGQVANEELWLVTNFQRGVLVTCTEKRDAYIRREFPNGCTTQRVTSVEELRDALTTLFPPQRTQQSQQVNRNHQNNTTSRNYPQGLDEVKRFELFRSVIDHEDGLLNERVSWIILAQSFLMAAFITSTGSNTLRYITAGVGLAFVVVTMPAIVAAGRNIEVQQQVYFRGLESDVRAKQLHGHMRDLSVKDANERKERHLCGHIFPNMAFRSDTAVKILDVVVALAVVQFVGWCFLLIAAVRDW